MKVTVYQRFFNEGCLVKKYIGFGMMTIKEWEHKASLMVNVINLNGVFVGLFTKSFWGGDHIPFKRSGMHVIPMKARTQVIL